MRYLFCVFAVLASIHVSAGSVRAAGTERLAVLLIDMQYGFYERGGATNTTGLRLLVEKQIELLQWAKARNVPVLVLEYEDFDSTDTRLMDEIEDHRFAVVIKNQDNGFTNPAVAETLHQWQVDSLIVAGINGCCCVQGSVLGALDAGFTVSTTAQIVGNINYSEPVYPNDTWFFEHERFFVYDSLTELTTAITSEQDSIPSPLLAAASGL